MNARTNAAHGGFDSCLHGSMKCPALCCMSHGQEWFPNLQACSWTGDGGIPRAAKFCNPALSNSTMHGQGFPTS